MASDLRDMALQEFLPQAIDVVKALARRAQALVDRELRLESLVAAERWRTWARGAFEGGARQAHRWTRTPSGWLPRAVNHDGQETAFQHHALQAEAARLAGIWQRRDEEHVLPALPPGGVAPITAQDVARASASFAAGASQTFDGFHVRHYGATELSLEATATLLNVIEAVQRMPTVLRYVLTILIPKPRKQAYRGLGMFCSLYRLWARVRRRSVVLWELAHPMKEFAFQRGAGCVQAVWRQAMAAEQAACTGRHCAAFLWDLSSFFDYIDRDRLLARGLEQGLPGALMGIALSTYGGGRAVTLGPFASVVGHTRKGVPPGCGFATFFVQAYHRPPIIRHAAMHPRVQHAIYIDDFSVSTCSHSEEQVVRDLVADANDLLDLIQVDLASEVSLPKCGLVASSARLLTRLRAAFREYGGPETRSVPNLGIEFTAGRSRAAAGARTVRRGRLRLTGMRIKRVRRVKRVAAAKTRRLYTCGLAPNHFYGADVMGIDNVELDQARRQWLATLPVGASGRSRTLALALYGDPTFMGATAPIRQYAKEVWRAAMGPAGSCRSPLSLPELAAAWREVWGAPPRSWAKVRGPIAALYVSCERLHCVMEDPFRIQPPQRRDAHPHPRLPQAAREQLGQVLG